MGATRVSLVLALVTGFLVGGAPRAADQAPVATPSPSTSHVTRIFWLQGLDSREAVTLLRSQIGIRQMAQVGDSDVIVVCDVADRVDRSESLLRERDAVLRAADPHEPLEFDRPEESPQETRVFPVGRENIKTAVVLLRAIYRIRDLQESAEDGSVSVRAAPRILDSSEALLRELGLLVEPAKAQS